MWSCVLLADGAETGAGKDDLAVVPAVEPIAVVDAIGSSAARYVVVAAQRAHAEPLTAAVAIAAGRFPEVRIATMLSDHAPLAIFSTLLVARGITPEPARGVALVRSLLANCWSGAWTGSVARLAHPAPGLGQHLRSLLPGEGFLVRNQPSPAVLGRLGPADVPPVGLDRVLLMQEGAVPPAFARRLAELPGVTGTRHVTVPGAWTSVYGTDRVGQVALVPADPHQMLPATGHDCPACQLPQSEAVCPFCHVVVTPAPVVGQGAS